ncbi:hypothetical protein [Frigoriglobus tundricola]|uniref:Uncharacterized protein n=1 Tax=Frigoriglobus tundricola TaxID=2774151 RepID=A0A6M5YJW1_9BACT|nr:hypothetical protein [Frigoriglobus tundricola]QJW94268.1 hypothetical protein FTUN_1788 [Frigoriglobus tundricola]
MTLRVRSVVALALLAAIAICSPGAGVAQDKDKDKEQATKAKAAAVENLKKIKITKPTVIETDNFIVAGSIPEAKAKALGAVLEKTLPVARKAAKYDDKESPWKGKLTVYLLPDSEEFKPFLRRVLQAPVDGTYLDFRAEPPVVVDPGELPGKPTDADLYANTAARIAGELLRTRGTGTQVVPEWLRDGFGRVSVMRAEGTNSKRYAAYKVAAKNAVQGAKTGTPPAVADVWSGEKSAVTDVLANSFAEFLAFGPKAADFGKFLDGLRPTETVATPTVQNGFQAIGWKDDAAVDAAWKKWVLTGK